MTIQNKNIPALRFPEFEGEWKEKEYSSLKFRKVSPICLGTTLIIINEVFAIRVARKFSAERRA